MHTKKQQGYLVINISFFLIAFISRSFFDANAPIALIPLFLFAFMNGILFFYQAKLNKFILLFVLYHIGAAILYADMRNLAVVAFYCAMIVIYSYLSINQPHIKMGFVYAMLISNYINWIYFVVSKPVDFRYKTIGPIKIFISYYESISFSSANLIALLSVILVFYLRSKNLRTYFIKMTTIAISLFIISTSGKVSIIAGLLAACAASVFFFFKERYAGITKMLVVCMIIISYSLSWILAGLSGFLEQIGINYHHISSGRDVIWEEYMEYFWELPLFQKLFGSFFVRTYNDVISASLPHPHNQWLLLLISIGVIGLGFYFVLLMKAYGFTIKTGDRIGFAYLIAINVYSLMDDYIFFTPSCIYMFLIVYFSVRKRQDDNFLYSEGKIHDIT